MRLPLRWAREFYKKAREGARGQTNDEGYLDEFAQLLFMSIDKCVCACISGEMCTRRTNVFMLSPTQGERTGGDLESVFWEGQIERLDSLSMSSLKIPSSCLTCSKIAVYRLCMLWLMNSSQRPLQFWVEPGCMWVLSDCNCVSSLASTWLRASHLSVIDE